MNKQNFIQKNRNFFNNIAKHYDNQLLKSWFMKALKKTINLIKIKENSKILDIGCGTGNLLKILEDENKNLEIYGIDISEKMLEIAKTKLKISKLSIQSAENIDFKDNSFDLVFSTEAFHHYSDYNLIMNNIKRVLKKHGRLIVMDVDFGFFLNAIFHIIEPGNNKMHSPLEFKRLFKEHNFKNIYQKRINLFFILTVGEI